MGSAFVTLSQNQPIKYIKVGSGVAQEGFHRARNDYSLPQFAGVDERAGILSSFLGSAASVTVLSTDLIYTRSD